MRIFSSLYIARGNPKEPVPFKSILPLKLKPGVSGKENEFNQLACPKEIEAFQKCYMNNLETKKVKHEKEAKGVLTPGEKSLSDKQINVLLRKFPNVK